MNLSERLQHIKARWLEIKQQDPEYRIQGAMSHHYKLDQEPVSRQAVEDFEDRHQVQLPEEYREYLVSVSNGGAGPCHQMYALHDALSPLCRGTKGEASYCNWLEENPAHYMNAFPVTEEAIIAFLRRKLNHATEEAPPILMDHKEPGYLFLCTVEPGTHYIMPVKGACVNEVWMMKEATRLNSLGKDEPYFKLWPEVRFENDQIKTLSFLEWIEDAQHNWFNKDVSLDHRLAAVKTTWFNLAAHDRELSVFGAFMHHYVMNPVLDEQAVMAFEQMHCFAIPGEYRRYLQRVTNGGVGPFYGAYSLENCLIPLNSGSREDGNFINYLEEHPDHFTKAFPVRDEELRTYLSSKFTHPSAPLKPFKLPKDAGGYLFLSEYGCGGYYIMPVNGEGAGEVWFLQKTDANKLSFELRDEDGKLVDSGSYGDDGDDSFFEIYPELKWNNTQASTVNFLEWIEHRQRQWFSDGQETLETTVEASDQTQAYFPLSVGNTWTIDFDGQPIVTTIAGCNAAGEYMVTNSLDPVQGLMKKVKGEYYSDALEKGTMRLMLKDALLIGDSWEVNFKANGLDCAYIYTVKEILTSKRVGDTEYKDVVMLELDSYFVLNGNRMSMNAFTQNYYAKGVGLILTTTSGVLGNNSYPLVSYELNNIKQD